MKENKEAVIKAPKNALKVTDGAEKPYLAGIDIIKILAVFLVVCIHFSCILDFIQHTSRQRNGSFPLLQDGLHISACPCL